jgi:iron complex transport system substrate-binding protein
VEDATCEWLDGVRPRIVSLHPNALADLWQDITHVAQALQVEKAGRELIYQLQQRIENLRDRASQLSQAAGAKPRVACIEWLNPLMAAGNWVPELVELAGGENLLGEAGKHSPMMTWESLVALDPDVLIIMPCGFDIPRTESEMFNVTAQPEWPNLKAVRNGRVHIVDGNQYFNRPGPRLVDSLEILIEILYPHPNDPQDTK